MMTHYHSRQTPKQSQDVLGKSKDLNPSKIVFGLSSGFGERLFRHDQFDHRRQLSSQQNKNAHNRVRQSRF
jgi:hypothetical protein